MNNILKFVLALVFAVVSANAQWKEFVDKFGSAMPVDYTNPMSDYAKKIEWFTKARPALEKYSAMVMLEFQCRNFVSEEITLSMKNYQSSPVGWGFAGKVSRGGLKMGFVLQPLTPAQFSPKEFVDKFERDWNAVRNELLERPWRIQELGTEIEVKSFKELFLYMPEQPKCQVVFEPGVSCTLELSSGEVSIKPVP